MAKLGDICFQITDGSHNPPAGIENSKHLMLSSKNINDDEITTTAPRFLTDEQFDIENKRTNVLSGDLLMTIVGTVGRVAVVPEMLAGICLQRSVAVIKPNPTIINNRYLMYQLQSMRKFLESEARGVAQKGIYLKQVGDLSVITPPLDEQYRVVDTLDHISGLIHIYQQQLTKLDELIKARFVEMFGDPISNTKRWDVIELGSLTGIGSSKRIFEKEYVSEGIPFYRTKEIVELSKGNPISTELYITEKRFLEIKEQYGVPQKGDLLISAVGTIGVIWIVDEKNDFYFKDGNLIRVDSSDRFNSTYMKTLLESLIAEYKKQMSSGTAYSALTISGLMKMKIYDVPLSLQNQFAAFVAEVDKSKVEVQKALDQTQLLFDSLMQQYFG